MATDEAAPVFDRRAGDLAVELNALAGPAGDDESEIVAFLVEACADDQRRILIREGTKQRSE